MQAVPKIPGYELLKRLGGGPITSVYTALDCADKSVCAVKVLRADWEDQPTAIKLLQREARAGLGVRHPRVVKIVHAHVTRPPYFLAMEFLKGESLRRRLRREYRLELAVALWVTRQMAEALAALHRLGFIHGDVKPDNIRLVEDGQAVLIDLGFAHRPGENAHLLKKGYVLGTVDYLAPELCAFDPKADQRADMFSLGVCLYEMLAGRLPYPGGTIAQTLQRHCQEAPENLRRHAPLLPPGVEDLVERLLARQPEDRPKAFSVVQQLVGLEIATLRQRRAA